MKINLSSKLFQEGHELRYLTKCEDTKTVNHTPEIKDDGCIVVSTSKQDHSSHRDLKGFKMVALLLPKYGTLSKAKSVLRSFQITSIRHLIGRVGITNHLPHPFSFDSLLRNKPNKAKRALLIKRKQIRRDRR